MNRKLAEVISSSIANFSASHSPDFSIVREHASTYLNNFHKWVNKRYLISADRVTRDDGSDLYVVLVDSKKKDFTNFYCMLFPNDRSAVYAEIWKVVTAGGQDALTWKYIPKKRDGLNDQRMQYFKQHIGSLTMQISIPTDLDSVPRFLRDLFDLADNRVKADILDSNKPEVRQEFPEGALIERIHRTRERNSSVVAFVKNEEFRKQGSLECRVCGFDFSKTYGALGKGYIEAHHVLPLSEITAETKTRPEDLVLVCSNCHRMLHRRRPWLSVQDLKSILDHDTA